MGTPNERQIKPLINAYCTTSLNRKKPNSLNSGSAQVQIMLSGCPRLAMARISGDGPGYKEDLIPFVGQSFSKAINSHRHHHANSS